jgi:O-antigen/teichoic acid export membrane protein
MLMSVVTIVVGLIAQRVFINTLGAEYLGINGLFTSIVSMLAIVELGLGSAIYYHLYKPVADGDDAKVRSLVSFYKKGYRLIAALVFLLGMLVIPFLSGLVGDVSISENIYVIYLLFLLDVVFSYLLTYKRAVLYVDQNNHIISTVHLGYLVIMNALQILVLLTTGNFYLYLIIKILMRLAENIVLTMITNKKYPYLKDKVVAELDQATKSDIFKKVRGLSYHKVASYVVLGTDNILISVFLGVAVVGLYSNYLLVTTAIIMLISQAFTAITASVGNLLVSVDHKKTFDVYKKLRLGNFWLACFAATSLLVVMDSFITLWIGADYLLPLGVLAAICLNLYMTLMRSSVSSFKEASGIFHEDRFVPVVESIANLIFSIIFLKIFGLAGVFLGTACSTLILHLFSYPKYVYKPLFKQDLGNYYRQFFGYFVVALFVAGITFSVSRLINLDSAFATFLINIILCLLIPNVILLVIFRNNSELKFYKDLMKKSSYSLVRRIARS